VTRRPNAAAQQRKTADALPADLGILGTILGTIVKLIWMALWDQLVAGLSPGVGPLPSSGTPQ
jgi:flagellar motor component MotA